MFGLLMRNLFGSLILVREENRHSIAPYYNYTRNSILQVRWVYSPQDFPLHPMTQKDIPVIDTPGHSNHTPRHPMDSIYMYIKDYLVWTVFFLSIMNLYLFIHNITLDFILQIYKDLSSESGMRGTEPDYFPTNRPWLCNSNLNKH